MLTNKIKISNMDIKHGYLNIPISSNISPNIRQDENIYQIFEREVENSTNKILDFEKIKLNPSTDINFTGITDSINIKLHFFNTSGNTWDLSATTINMIGFSADNVKYISNSLKKSFLSIKIYDSNDINTQNMIGYSVIFFDVYDMYEQYNKNNYTITGISSEFILENPLLTKKQNTNESFNLYLYKQDINKTEIKDVYLKFEFNNALNGKTILFCDSPGLSNNGDNIPDIIRKMFIRIKCKYANGTYYYSFFDYNNEEKKYDNIQNVINIDIYQVKAV